MSSIDFKAPVDIEVGGGHIILRPPATIEVVGLAGQTSMTVPCLEASNFVEMWCGDAWCAVIGLKGKSLLIARPALGTLTVVGELNRLDLEGGYDPGGLERIEFHELPDGDLLLIHEFGAARVSPSDGLKWQRAHDDLTARVSEVGDHIVWLQGERDRFGYRLSDGQSVLA